jgi:hypothetical protein
MKKCDVWVKQTQHGESIKVKRENYQKIQ